MNNAESAFHLCLGRETFASLAGDFEIGFFSMLVVVCHTASVVDSCG
jgi:hypothetical protein